MDQGLPPDNLISGLGPLDGFDSSVFDSPMLSMFDEHPFQDDSLLPPIPGDALDMSTSCAQQQALSEPLPTTEVLPSTLFDREIFGDEPPENDFDAMDFDLALPVNPTIGLTRCEEIFSNTTSDQPAFDSACQSLYVPNPPTPSLESLPFEHSAQYDTSTALADPISHNQPSTSTWIGTMPRSTPCTLQDPGQLSQICNPGHRILLPAPNVRSRNPPIGPWSPFQSSKDNRTGLKISIHHTMSKDKNGTPIIKFGNKAPVPKRRRTEAENRNRREVHKVGGQCLVCRILRRRCDPGEICVQCKANQLQNSIDLSFTTCLRLHPSKFIPFTLDGSNQDLQPHLFPLLQQQSSKPLTLRYRCFHNMFETDTNWEREDLKPLAGCALSLGILGAFIFRVPDPSWRSTVFPKTALSLYEAATSVLANPAHLESMGPKFDLEVEHVRAIRSYTSSLLFDFLEEFLRFNCTESSAKSNSLSASMTVATTCAMLYASMVWFDSKHNTEGEKMATATAKVYLLTYFSQMWMRFQRTRGHYVDPTIEHAELLSGWVERIGRERTTKVIFRDVSVCLEDLKPHPATGSPHPNLLDGDRGILQRVEQIVYSLFWSSIPPMLAERMDLTTQDFSTLRLLENSPQDIIRMHSSEQFWRHWDVKRVEFIFQFGKFLSQISKTKICGDFCVSDEVATYLWYYNGSKDSDSFLNTVSETFKSSFRVFILIFLHSVGLTSRSVYRKLTRSVQALGMSDAMTARFAPGWGLAMEIIKNVRPAMFEQLFGDLDDQTSSEEVEIRSNEDEAYSDENLHLDEEV